MFFVPIYEIRSNNDTFTYQSSSPSFSNYQQIQARIRWKKYTVLKNTAVLWLSLQMAPLACLATDQSASAFDQTQRAVEHFLQ